MRIRERINIFFQIVYAAREFFKQNKMKEKVVFNEDIFMGNGCMKIVLRVVLRQLEDAMTAFTTTLIFTIFRCKILLHLFH
jgi:predicted GH43/DUF377 family glycosyl hydrolase